MTETAENPYLLGCTYLYSSYNGVIPRAPEALVCLTRQGLGGVGGSIAK